MRVWRKASAVPLILAMLVSMFGSFSLAAKSASAADDGDILLAEDFSGDSLPGWTVGGDLTLAGGMLHSGSWSSTQEAVYGGQAFEGPYSYRVEMTPAAAGSNWNATRLLWGYQDASNYYEVILGNGALDTSGTAGNVSLVKVVGGAEMPLADSVNYLVGGIPTSVQVDVYGDGRMSVQALQGSTVTTLYDQVTDDTFSSGYVGVGMRQSVLDFDSVTVTSGIQPLTAPVVPTVPVPTMADGNFAVSGTDILDPDGNSFVAKGVNVNGPRWPWPRDTLQDVGLIADTWKFNTVRVNMYPLMAHWNINNNMDLDGIVTAFTSKHIVTILEDHDFTGLYPQETGVTQSDGSYLMSVDELKAYWHELAEKYKDNPYVWFNLLNEPGLGGLSVGDSEEKWAAVNEAVIHEIRDVVGAGNIIVLDGHSYGQEGGTKNGVSDSAILTKGPELNDEYDNLVFSLHMYAEWMDGQQRLETYLDTAAEEGLAVLIGEYGAGENATISSTQAMFNAAVPRNVGRIAWAWAGGDQYDLTDPLTTTAGGGWEIDKTDGSRPGNLSWFGSQVWDDNHGTLVLPVTSNIPVLANGSFEAGMDSWQNWSRAEVDAGIGIDGSQAFKVPAGGQGGGGQFVIVKPNTTYKLTVWGKVSAAPQGGSSDAGFQYRPTDSSPDADQIKYILSFTDTEWTKKEVTFTTGPSVAQANVFIWQSAANADLLIDNVSLAELPPLLANGGFESGLTGSDWLNWGNAVIESDDVHSGTQALKVPAGAPGGGGQFVSLQPNTTYKLTAWGKVSGVPDGGTATVGFQYRPTDSSPDSDQIQSMLDFTDTAWTMQEVTFTTGASVAQANVFIWNSAVNVDLLVDDVQLTEASPDDGDGQPPAQPQPDITVSGVSFRDASGGEATSLPAGGLLYADATVTNNGAAQQATLVVALYDANGDIAALSFMGKELAAGEAITFTGGFNLPANTAGYTAKVMVWNNLQEMTPLADAVELNG